MISEVRNKPSVFGHLETACRWFEAYETGCSSPYAYWALQYGDDKSIGIHLEVMCWSHNILRQMIVHDWPWLKNEAKKMGATTLFAANKNYQDERWPKLIKHFGFPKPQVLALSVQEV